jgi:hypothetical protein
MKKMEAMCEVIIWLVFGQLAFCGFFDLYSKTGFGKGTLYWLLFSAIGWFVGYLIWRALSKLWRPQWKKACHYAATLTHWSRFDKFRAVHWLSRCFGERFGHPSCLSQKALDRSASLWAKWWRENKDKLVWDPVVQAYVESQVEGHDAKSAS